MTETIKKIKIDSSKFEKLVGDDELSMTCKHFEAMCENAIKGVVNALKAEDIHNNEIINSARGIATVYIKAVSHSIINMYRNEENIKVDAISYLVEVLRAYEFYVNSSRLKETNDYTSIVGILHMTINELLKLTCPGYGFNNNYFGIYTEDAFYYI